MRAIAGSARGRLLSSPSGNRIRPTSDRVKEAVFSSLTSRFGAFDRLQVLDLFAGSGSLGIEALSRGAKHAVLVDSHPDSIRLIKNNLVNTGLADSAEVLLMDAAKAVRELSGKAKRFDIIFADPPYTEKATYEKIMQLISEIPLTSETAVIVIESDSRFHFHPAENLRNVSRKVYGDTAIWMFERIDQPLLQGV